jgi:hypothetical protein
MDDRFMDCPTRERSQWIGDARIEAVGAALLFGDSRLHRRFIREVARSQYEDGCTDPVGPGEWNEFEPNRPIAGFTALWIASVLDYYQLTADGETLVELLPSVTRAIDWLGSFRAESGLLTDVKGWNFTDWAPGLVEPGEGAWAPVNLFYLNALCCAARIAEIAGDYSTAFAAQSDALAGAIAERFWDPKRGLFVDHFCDGTRRQQISRHTNILAVLFGAGDESQRRAAMTQVMENKDLVQIGSPYFGYYLLEALYRQQRHADALDYIRRIWGGMLDAGATTWWENNDPLASRCHAWSIAPSIGLLTQQLGVRGVDPGFELVEIAPQPVDLEWAKGIVPIPQGDVVISWIKGSSRFTLDVSVPAGVHIRPKLPAAPADRLYMDGEPISEDSIVRRTDREAELCVLPGVGYRFEVIGGEDGRALG